MQGYPLYPQSQMSGYQAAESKTARQILKTLLATAKHSLARRSGPVRKLTKRFSVSTERSLSKRTSAAKATTDKPGVSTPPAPRPTPIFTPDNYCVASASQLNGRHLELALRQEQHIASLVGSPRQRPWTQSMRNRISEPDTLQLVRSQTTPILITPLLPRERVREPSEEIQPYSPSLSTIAEQTEPEIIRPLSEVLSIGEARVGRILPASQLALDYQTTITRFATKAMTLIHELGPLLEVYGRREVAIQSAPDFDVNSPAYFRPHVTRLFSKCCICDMNIKGDPIKLASKGFEVGSAGLQIGARRYLNLDANAQPVGRTAILRTEHDPLAKSTRYMIHYAMPLTNDSLHTHYTLVAQVDVTSPLRRLALQESATAPASPVPAASRTAVSSQMRRFLSFIHWLGTFHSNALCFTRPSTTVNGGGEWSLRFAAPSVYSDPSMAVHVGPASANTERDMEHMALMMDGERSFCQSVVCGGGKGLTHAGEEECDGEGECVGVKGCVQGLMEHGGKSYLQYCVPVVDGQTETAQKWWVCWLVEKTVPGFWGRSSGGLGEEVVEYPFLT